MIPRSVLLGTLVLVPACSRNPNPAVLPVPSCSVGDTLLIRETLYFGRNRSGGGTVSDAEWKSFLAEVVTTRFPHGLTVQEATGQWRGAGGAVEQERSEVLTVFHPDDDAARRSVQEIALEYKRRFQQEAVLRERAPSCTRLE